MSAILTDEIGIEFALLGKFRARARYRPVYARAGHALLPAAVHGEMAITQNGADVAPEAMLGNDPSPAARQALDLLALALIVRNHPRSDADRLNLHLDFPAGPSRDIALEALEELASPGIEARRMAVFMRSSDVTDIGTVGPLRQAGYRLGLVAELDDPALGETIAATRPHIVRIEGGWLAKAAQSEALKALLARFVSSCGETGAQVLLSGIDDRSRLLTALDLGAGYFAGEALGLSLGAGAVMDLLPLSVDALAARAPNVLPFARRRPG